MVKDVFSGDPARQLDAATKFRELLSEENPPIEQVIECGVVPRFVQFLQGDDSMLQVSPVPFRVYAGPSRLSVPFDHTLVFPPSAICSLKPHGP